MIENFLTLQWREEEHYKAPKQTKLYVAIGLSRNHDGPGMAGRN